MATEVERRERLRRLGIVGDERHVELDDAGLVKRMRVPLMLCDAAPMRALIADAATDAMSDAQLAEHAQRVALMADGVSPEQAAYLVRREAMKDEVSNAWRGPDQPKPSPAMSAADAYEDYCTRTQNAWMGPERAAARIAADAAPKTIADAHAEYCERIQNAWKNPPTA